MKRRGRKMRSAVGNRSISQDLFAVCLALSLGAMWFLYRVLEVKEWWALWGLALAAGLGLTVTLGGMIALMKRSQARPAALAAAVDIYGGFILIGLHQLMVWQTQAGGPSGVLLSFGLFLVLFGLAVLILGRLRLFERLPL